MRIAVIGTGIAGNAAAWALSQRYPVTVYDRELRPGGHSHTVTIDYDGTAMAVDIGFIVYNELNYPELTKLFAHLGVATIESDMTFAVTADRGRFEWKGGGSTWWNTAKGVFAQPRNLLSPTFLWMLRDILVFNDKSIADHRAGLLAGLSLGEYFKMREFAPRLLSEYLAPMGAAIWSAPASQILDFPAENFVAFFSNHRLLQYDRPVWRTVKGGSQAYVEKLTASFRNHLRLGCAVTSIERTTHGVVVNDSHGLTVRELKGAAEAGLNRVNWDLTREKEQRVEPPESDWPGQAPFVAAGEYEVVLTVGKEKSTAKLSVSYADGVGPEAVPQAGP